MAAAGVAFVPTATVVAAQEATVTATTSFPTLDRRALIAPSAEFNHLKALARGNGHVRVIVGLRVAFTPEGALSSAGQEAQRLAIAAASGAVQRALRGTDHHVTRTYEIVPLIALELSESAVSRLESSDLAATLWEDTPRPPSAIVEDAIKVKPGARGKSGLAVAVLDNGVDSGILRTVRVVSEACFSANGSCPNGRSHQIGIGAGRPCDYPSRGCLHGTHVAAAATTRTEAADIIAIQVFSRFTDRQCRYEAEDSCALTFESDHIAGLQHVFQLRDKFKIRAASLSIGNGLFSLGCNDNPLKLAIDSLRSVGISTLIASGNGGLRDLANGSSCISTVMAVDAKDLAAADLTRTAKAPALPDLVLTHAGLIADQNYSIRGERMTFEWAHTTKNIKPLHQKTQTAPASQTVFIFKGKKNNIMDVLNVPELSPNEDNNGSTKFKDRLTDLDFGTYETEVCADGSHQVKERNEHNNCVSTGHQYVIPARLIGTVTGTTIIQTGFGNSNLDWEGTVEFTFARRLPHAGTFSYRISPGSSIEYTVSGTIALPGTGFPCVWSGNKTYLPEASDELVLRFGPQATYTLHNTVRHGFQMTYTLTCETDKGEIKIDAPQKLQGSLWVDNGDVDTFPDPGLISITGDFTRDGPVKSIYTWDLKALDPEKTPVTRSQTLAAGHR